MREILLTSGYGPVAHALITRRVAAGEGISVLGRRPLEIHRVVPGSGNVTSGGVVDSVRLSAELGRFDAVIDNRPPALTGSGEAARSRGYLVETRQLLTAAIDTGVSRFVVIKPIRQCGLDKKAMRYASEMVAVAQRYGLSVVVVEHADVFGPEFDVTTDLNRLIVRVALGMQPVVPIGTTNVLYSADVAEAALQLVENLTAGSRTLPGSRHSYRQIAQTVSETARRSQRVVAVPRAVVRAVESAKEIRAKLNGRKPPLRSCDFPRTSHHVGNTTWPTVLLHQDIAKTIAHFTGGRSTT